jgi:hypothetical protein
MQSVEITCELGISADAAWRVLADFPGFLKWAAGRQGSIEIEGEGIGMIRHMDLPGVGKMAERLDQLEHSASTSTIGYSLVYGNPAGLGEYSAVATLTSTGANSCKIDWHGEFTPAEGEESASVAKNLETAYQGMSEALTAYVQDG